MFSFRFARSMIAVNLARVTVTTSHSVKGNNDLRGMALRWVYAFITEIFPECQESSDVIESSCAVLFLCVFSFK